MGFLPSNVTLTSPIIGVLDNLITEQGEKNKLHKQKNRQNYSLFEGLTEIRVHNPYSAAFF